MNGNGEGRSPDPATLERQSDAIRADMGQTLDALQRNYSPGALLDRSIDLFKEHGGELTANLGRSVKQNPMPALLTLVGVGWMIASDSRAPRTAAGAPSEGDHDSAGSVGAGLKDRVHRVADGTHHAAERARGQSQRARAGLQTLLQEQPFLVGAVGIALGAVLGAVLPESEREDRLLGAARDSALDKVDRAGARGIRAARERVGASTSMQDDCDGARPDADPDASHAADRDPTAGGGPQHASERT